MTKRNFAGVVTLVGAMCLAPGCSSKTLLFTTYTNIGLDVSAANGAPTRAVFGYKRFEGAVVPVDPSQRTSESGEAMSVFAAIDMTNGWLDGLSVLQVFATGDAAQEAAKKPEAFAMMLQKFGRVSRQGGENANRGSGEPAGDDEDSPAEEEEE